MKVWHREPLMTVAMIVGVALMMLDWIWGLPAVVSIVAFVLVSTSVVTRNMLWVRRFQSSARIQSGDFNAHQHTPIPVERLSDPATGERPGPIVAYLCTDTNCGQQLTIEEATAGCKAASQHGRPAYGWTQPGWRNSRDGGGPVRIDKRGPVPLLLSPGTFPGHLKCHYCGQHFVRGDHMHSLEPEVQGSAHGECKKWVNAYRASTGAQPIRMLTQEVFNQQSAVEELHQISRENDQIIEQLKKDQEWLIGLPETLQ